MKGGMLKGGWRDAGLSKLLSGLPGKDSGDVALHEMTEKGQKKR